eukprot:5720942-Prymnesium_polylepis.1
MARHCLDDCVHRLRQCPRRLGDDAHQRQRGVDDLWRRDVVGRAEQLASDARDLVEEGHGGAMSGPVVALLGYGAARLRRVSVTGSYCTIVRRSDGPGAGSSLSPLEGSSQSGSLNTRFSSWWVGSVRIPRIPNDLPKG